VWWGLSPVRLSRKRVPKVQSPRITLPPGLCLLPAFQWRSRQPFAGQARVAAAACEGIARNPGAAGPIRLAMILGLVFIETLALFTLAIVFAKVGY
jgi:ATP synthase subunit C